MAKKKATMTLKDFHGGSIPSDLPLPSAPGVIARPSNHVGFDRQTSWGNPIGRQDHRLRPGSAGAGAVRTYDDKTPFLTPSAQIGRNFDEDERKPLDGVSAPRRTFSDESIRGSVPVSQEPKSDFPVAGNTPSRPATTPVSQFSGGSTNLHTSRFSQAANVGSGRTYPKNEGRASRQSGPNVGVANTSHPNAWGLRKEAVGVSDPVATSWSAPDAATKLAHASALEKVSSGRWHSNQQKQIDVEGIRHLEPEAETPTKGNTHNTLSYSSTDMLGAREFHGVSVAPSESLERPKLKLLPRSKSVENSEHPIAYKQGIPQPNEPPLVNTGNETYGNANSTVQGYAGPEGERPKLNLRPRSQPIEQSERNMERERKSLFGGARPRELVLKERGVDDVAVNQDMIQSPDRSSKRETPRSDNQTPEPELFDRGLGKRDVVDKSEAQRRGGNRRTDRPPSPETWRKPAATPLPAAATAGPRHGKAASAVELAQAFSNSVLDPKLAADRFPGQRGLAGRGQGQGQVPFSRLTAGQPARAHINGY